MKTLNKSRRSAMAAAVLGLLASTGAMAQSEDMGRAARPLPPMVPPIRPLPMFTKLHCCKCLVEASVIDISTGFVNTTDPSLTPHWYVTPPGGTVPVPVVNTALPASAWGSLTAPQPVAKWVDDLGNGNPAAKLPGPWVFEMQIYVPFKECRIPFVRPPSISGAFLADNSAQLMVNGTPITVAMTTNAPYGFLAANKGVITNAPLHWGLNSIKVVVTNDSTGSPLSLGTPMGFMFNGLVRQACDSSPNVPSPSGPPTSSPH